MFPDLGGHPGNMDNPNSYTRLAWVSPVDLRATQALLNILAQHMDRILRYLQFLPNLFH